MKKVRRGEIHCILVKDFSRFGRSYIEDGDYLEQISPFLRVRFISVNDDFDSARQECSAGDVSVAFKSLCNDYYSKDLSRKVRSGIAALRDGGKYHASTAPFGYIKDSADIHRIVADADADADAIVRRVYEMALGGMGAKMITKTLNAENILTPGRYKLDRTGRKVGYNTNNVWTGGAVRTILKDVRYTGLLVQGMTRCSVVGDNRHHLVPKEQWHISPTRHEAIVSEEEYEAVQSLSRSPKSTVKRPHTVHPLSRKVRCGGCGHVMSRSNAKNPAYLCGYKALYTGGDCPRKGIKVSAVEEIVLAALRGVYSAFAAIKIMLWRVYKKTFSLICQHRYDYASKKKERMQLEKLGRTDEIAKLEAQFLREYDDIPDQTLNNYSLFGTMPAIQVDYDRVIYDTYDYMDKLIGLKLTDIFYAIFHQYYQNQPSKEDNRALRLAKYIRYGTDDERNIWMLRYGLTFEDIEWANNCIDSINEQKIIFNDKYDELTDEQKKIVERFNYPDAK